jgi:hypothetical protein
MNEDNRKQREIRYHILSEYRGALIKFIDIKTKFHYMLRADKIVNNQQLLRGFNNQEEETIKYIANQASCAGVMEELEQYKKNLTEQNSGRSEGKTATTKEESSPVN